MKKIETIDCQRVLSPTGITQADYVINPYRGCFFGCSFCYAQWNKFALKYDMSWGDYVHVKLNAPQKLDDELGEKSGRDSNAWFDYGSVSAC